MRDKPKGVHMSGDAGAFPKCEMKTPISPPSRCAILGRAEPELVGLLGKALTRDAMRKFRFIVHAAGWLHSMMLHGHLC